MQGPGFRNVDSFAKPESFAIVGGSPRPGNYGARVYRSLQHYGYRGAVSFVNPGYDTVLGAPCYPRLSALPYRPDHVVVVVPAPAVLEVIEEAGQAGARSATILTAGFAELGTEEGRQLQERLRAAAERSGVRLLGPNCMGFVSSGPGAVVFAEQGETVYRPGGFSLISQSGGMMGGLLRSATQRGIGIRYSFSTGNEVDCDAADFLHLLVEDPDTRVIGLLLEGVRRPDAFVACATESLRRGKPLIVLHTGRSEAGRAAVRSHTGAISTSGRVFDAVCRRRGMVRVDTPAEMIESAEAFLRTGEPRGDGLGVIALSGGARGLICDRAEDLQLPMASLEASTHDALAALLPAGSSAGNPLDLGWIGILSPETYLACVRLFLDDPHVGLLAVQDELPADEATAGRAEVLAEIEKAARSAAKPVVFYSRAPHNVSALGLEVHERLGAPFLQDAGAACGTIERLITYHRRRRARLAASPGGAPSPRPEGDGRQGAAPSPADLVEMVTAAPSGVVDDALAFRLLEAAGVPVAPFVAVRSAAGAVEAAEGLGWPVALKASAPGLTHKTEVGGVRLHLTGAQELTHTLVAMATRLPAGAGFIVQKMADGVLEILMSCYRDAQFGPMVLVGLGGIWAEALGQVQVAVAPATPAEAAEVVSSGALGTILATERGRQAVDSGAVADALWRMVSLFRDSRGRIDTLEVNPLVVLRDRQGVVAVDAVVTLR